MKFTGQILSQALFLSYHHTAPADLAPRQLPGRPVPGVHAQLCRHEVIRVLGRVPGEGSAGLLPLALLRHILGVSRLHVDCLQTVVEGTVFPAGVVSQEGRSPGAEGSPYGILGHARISLPDFLQQLCIRLQ